MEKTGWTKQFDLKVKEKESCHKDTWTNRDIRLEAIGMTYPEYLQSEEWKRIKRKSFQRESYNQCKKCGCKQKLHLHHKHYKWIGTPHAMASLISLCDTCHNQVHKIASKMDYSVQKATRFFINGKIDRIIKLEEVKEIKKKNIAKRDSQCKLIINKQIFEALRSKNNGYKNIMIVVFNESWPPKRGWSSRVYNKVQMSKNSFKKIKQEITKEHIKYTNQNSDIFGEEGKLDYMDLSTFKP